MYVIIYMYSYIYTTLSSCQLHGKEWEPYTYTLSYILIHICISIESLDWTHHAFLYGQNLCIYLNMHVWPVDMYVFMNVCMYALLLYHVLERSSKWRFQLKKKECSISNLSDPPVNCELILPPSHKMNLILMSAYSN